MDVGVGADPVVRNLRADDFLAHQFVQIVGGDVWRVLGGEDDGIDAGRFAVFVVAEGELALGVGAEGLGIGAANFGLTADEAVGIGDGGWHEHVGFVGGVAEHEPLVAGALFVVGGFVDSLGDVGGLHPERVDDGEGVEIEPAAFPAIANLADDLPRQPIHIHHCSGANLAGEHHEPGLDEGFARDPRVGVLLQHGIEHRIRNLISHLVGMALGHRFGREYGVGEHQAVLGGGWGKGGDSKRMWWWGVIGGGRCFGVGVYEGLGPAAPPPRKAEERLFSTPPRGGSDRNVRLARGGGVTGRCALRRAGLLLNAALKGVIDGLATRITPPLRGSREKASSPFLGGGQAAPPHSDKR